MTCYTIGERPPLLRFAFHTFKSSTVKRCWYFCKFSEQCHVFSYNQTSTTCYMFHRITDKNHVKHVGSDAITFSMHCTEGGLCGNKHLGDLLIGNTGFYIQNVTTKECLFLHTSPEKDPQNFAKLHPTWVPCGQQGVMRWSVNVKQIYDATSLQDRASVRIAQGFLCIIWSSDQSIRVHPCYELTKPMLTDLIAERYPFEDCSISIIPNAPFLQVKGKIPIILANKPLLEEEPTANWSSPCRVSNTSIHQGFLVDDPAVPFYLPWDNVTVRCSEGFGVEEMGFAGQYSTPCSPQLKLNICVEIPASKAPTGSTQSTGDKNPVTPWIIFASDSVTENLPQNPFIFSTIILGVSVVLMTGLVVAILLCTDWLRPKTKELRN